MSFCRLCVLATLLGLSAAGLWAYTTVLETEHIDFRIDYTHEDGFLLRLEDRTNGPALYLDPAEALILLTPAAQLTVPANPLFEPLGAPAGETFWALPQVVVDGTVFLGTRASTNIDLLSPLPGAPPFGPGQCALRLVSVTGSGVDAGGQFSLYVTDLFGTPIFRYATYDGIGASEEIAPISAGSHTHYNWAFTQPGSYAVTVEARGNRRDNGEEVLAQQTYHFLVLDEASTHPRLRIESDGGGGLHLAWNAIPGRTYTILGGATPDITTMGEVGTLTPMTPEATYPVSTVPDRFFFALRYDRASD